MLVEKMDTLFEVVKQLPSSE